MSCKWSHLNGHYRISKYNWLLRIVFEHTFHCCSFSIVRFSFYYPLILSPFGWSRKTICSKHVDRTNDFFWYFSVSFSSLPQFKAIEQHNYAEYELVLNTIIYIMCGNMVSFLSFSRSQRAAASFPMGLLFTHTRFYAEFFCQLYYGFAFIGARHSVCDVCARAFFHMQNIFLSLIAQPKLNAIYWRWLIDNKFVVGPSEEAIDQQSKLMLWRKIMKKNL